MGENSTTASRIVFHYRGLLEDGSVFYDSTKTEPLQCEIGKHMIPQELEEALKQMLVGDERTVKLGMAYGSYDNDALQKNILKSAIENGESLQEGQEVLWRSPQNPQVPVQAKIVRADDYTFDIDFNHPLAGKNISYDVTMIAVS